MSSEKDDVGSRLRSAIHWTAALLTAFVLILYLGLIGLGQWQADEYVDFAALRSKGWRFFYERMLWSPRPVSELLLFIYGWMVNHFHRPLIAPFLAVLWAGFLAAGLATFVQTRGERSRDENSLALIVTLTLMALFLAGGGLTEVFYWPVGAAAYLPTLAATLLFFWQVVYGRLASEQGRALCFIALVVAALSSELGAMFAACFALVQVLSSGIHRWRKHSNPQDSAGLAWWAVPGLLSWAVLFIVWMNRFHQPEPGFTVAAATVGQPLLSSAVALRELGAEMLGRFPEQPQTRIAPTLISELLFCLGGGLCWSFARFLKFDRVAGWRMIAAFLLASWLSLTSSYLHFGTAGGQRHELLRHCWILMSFGGTGALLASPLSRWRPQARWKHRVLAPLALVLAVASVWHVREILREYRAYPSIARTIHENFRSGFDATTDQMVYAVAAHRGVMAFAQVEPGFYSRNPANASYPQYILRFFDKRTLIVRKQFEP